MAVDLLRWLRTGLACDFAAPQRLLLTGRQDALDERAALGSTNILVIGPQGESSGRSTIVSAMFNKKLEKGAGGQLEDVQISSGLDRAGRHLNIFDISSEVQPRSLLHILRKYPSLCIDRVVCVFCNRLARCWSWTPRSNAMNASENSWSPKRSTPPSGGSSSMSGEWSTRACA